MEQRFWDKVDKTGECWNWTAYIDWWGYGQYAVAHGERTPAHRYSYELVNGIIPDGKQLHHNCHNPRCVRPDHLIAVTRKEHVQLDDNPAKTNSEKTRCIRGHLLSGDNLREYDLKRGKRECRTCHNSWESRQ